MGPLFTMTNDHKPARAVALQYKDSESLPKVLATGIGELARQILKIAEDLKIPVQHDQALTEMLSSLPPGSVITPESYRLVAEIICFLYQTDKEWREKHSTLF